MEMSLTIAIDNDSDDMTANIATPILRVPQGKLFE